MSVLEKEYDALVADTREISTLGNVTGLLGWDQETYMPPKGIEARSEQLSLMSGIIHRRQTDPRRGAWLESLEKGGESLSDDQNATVRECRRVYDRLTKLPTELVEEETRTCSLAQANWVKARKASDFELFAPWLQKIVDIKKRITEHWGYSETPYDALLDEYEPGATVANTGEKLMGLRAKLVPWVSKIKASSFSPRKDFLSRGFPAEDQRRLGHFVMEAIGFDTLAGRLDTSTHPFCSGTGGDVRLTTRYYEDQPFASLFGVIHEAGHGLYEQGLNKKVLGAPLGLSSSMSVHESQSRLWENMVGRSKGFLRFIDGRLREIFPTQLSGVSLEDIYGAINQVEPSFIRVEADELTYGLHIVMRFEIERDLLSGELSINDVPATWNKKMEEYLGIVPKTDAEGCLQDIHWSIGALGYFPSYVLGSMNAAQIFAACRRDVPDLDEQFSKGEFSELLAWLRVKIHGRGRRYLPDLLIEEVTGKPPDPDDFMDYVAEKFGDLYGV